MTMRKLNFKKLQNQLLSAFMFLIIIVCIGLFFVSSYISKKAIVNTVQTILPNVATQASLAIENNINIRLKTLETLAENEKLQDENVAIKEKVNILLTEEKRSGHLKMSIIDINGKSNDTLGEEYDVKDTEYFKNGIEGKYSVSNPMTVNEKLVFIYSVPIIKDGNTVGVLTATRDENELSKYTNNIKVGETGQSFIINNEGTAIAHRDKNLVLKKDNNFENIKKDPELKSLAEIEKKMVAGENGIGEYNYGNKKKYIAYAPIKPVNWSIGVVIESGEILNHLMILIISVGITSLIGILIAVIFARRIVKSINKPIIASVENLKVIASGDLQTETTNGFSNRRDELGIMAKSIESMKQSIISMLNSIKTSSSDIKLQTNNVEEISNELKSSSKNIYYATNDVAKGTVNQSEDLIYITNILKGFSLKLDDIVDIIKNVDFSISNIKNMSYNSNKDMENVIESVKNVNNTFNELITKIKDVENNVNKINEITNLIDDISDQTNLLALNAAIEAARAGDSGKGFKIVASEIRKLAEQSKVSAVDISSLISKISKDTDLMVNKTKTMKKELDNQEKDIDTAKKSFETITVSVNDIVPKMVVTNNSVQNLNASKDDIMNKIESASSVAQEVSAAAEEIAASTEEMNKYAESLAKLVNALNDMSEDMMKNVNKFKI
ncbi:methyl-accepting chemotaxis protein [Clostridium botulinum B str. Eklund 17B (NRP)]|uniref:Methyl-accepting chemotaxis protein n=1 Tax=Clostridium botulinum (strain Eklund 17B / Type B) TaxID=935198 RepID=B2TRR3_CLOBB|nr:methyl-accepting chemotaxis protein [Clostridium botulinum B str. Eklund 17B (NRP)]MBY6976872.1 methyl-accepting chemotaxis protein [Clostridium botulinum]MBY7002050.1 methyl-accepting chemotaxis protein [Clostridium botulinum]CDH91100.1 methyl-accepting chemotaxis protein [Clostridium botulinum B str. Eklund 17B (NRP)]